MSLFYVPPLTKVGPTRICAWIGLCTVLYNMRKVARIPVSEARKNFANILALVAKGTRVKVTRYNQTLGGIVSSDDLISLTECEKERKARRLRKSKPSESTPKHSRSR